MSDISAIQVRCTLGSIPGNLPVVNPIRTGPPQHVGAGQIRYPGGAPGAPVPGTWLPGGAAGDCAGGGARATFLRHHFVTKRTHNVANDQVLKRSRCHQDQRRSSQATHLSPLTRRLTILKRPHQRPMQAQASNLRSARAPERAQRRHRLGCMTICITWSRELAVSPVVVRAIRNGQLDRAALPLRRGPTSWHCRVRQSRVL